MANSAVAGFLAGVFVVGTLYGLFFTLFCTYMILTAQERIKRNRIHESNKPLYESVPFVGSVLLFITVTPHWTLVVYQSFMAFVSFDEGFASLLYYAEMTTPPYLSVVAFTAAALVTGDCLLIWRLWTVWSHRRYVVIPPILGLLAGVGAFIGVIYKESIYEIGNPGSLAAVNNLMIGCYACTLSTNMYSCALICWRLWIKSRPLKVLGSGGLGAVSRALAIFTESAALYISWVFICLISSVTGSAATYCVAEAVVPITGIAFMLINVRVVLGRSLDMLSSGSRKLDHSLHFRSEPITLRSIRSRSRSNLGCEQD